jgi:hypothetical protein
MTINKSEMGNLSFCQNARLQRFVVAFEERDQLHVPSTLPPLPIGEDAG